MSFKGDSEEHVLHGDVPLYEPSEGGIGLEIFRSLSIHKEKVAQYVIETKEVDTYEDLRIRSIRTSLYLQKEGITKDDLVCSCSHNHINSCIPFISSALIGSKFTALETIEPEADIADHLRFMKPNIIFVAQNVEDKIERCMEKAQWKCKVIVFGKSSKNTSFSSLMQPVEGEESFKPVPLKSNKETSQIFLSSGTTGKPKGICASHYGLLGQTVNLIHIWKLGNSIDLSNYSIKFYEGNQYVIMSHTSLYWISGTNYVLAAILTGSAKIVAAKFEPNELWKIIEEYKVNHLFVNPANVVYLHTTRNNRNTSSVRLVLTGAATVTKKHMEQLKESFPTSLVVQAYGQTELTGVVLTFDINKPEDIMLQNKHPESCGRPYPGQSYKVVDTESGQIVGPTKPGELRVKSKYIMNGFLNTDSSDQFDAEGWFKTGDIVRYDENGCFYHLNRSKDVIKYRTFNVITTPIEAVLSQHPAVSESFVFGYPHEQDIEHAMGVVVLKTDHTNVTADELCEFVNEKMPDKYKLRAGIKIIENMLHTSTGKIKKLALKQLIIKGEL